MRRTKVVCTIGPGSDDPKTLEQLVMGGMNVARLNMSHGDYAEHGARIEQIKRLRDEKGLPVAIMMDTKGPEIRTGDMKDGPVELEAGQAFTLTTREVLGDQNIAHVTYSDLPADVHIGDAILIDDGLLELRVRAIDGADILCAVENSGVLGGRKGINIPGVPINIEAVTEKDRADIEFGAQQGLELVAMSFVRSAADVLTVRKLLDHLGSDMRIIAKIENGQGVAHLNEILRVADGIMVARGDLGVEIPIQQVPLVQKSIIHKCNRAGKPVITATQMLDSMIRNPRPTRAEASDVANSILDGTDAVMLSGETANGKYPVEALEMMCSIAQFMEGTVDLHDLHDQREIPTVTNAVSFACHNLAKDLHAAAIILPTYSGSTARYVARYRPKSILIATTSNTRTYHWLSLVWGVLPMLTVECDNTDIMIENSVAVAEKADVIRAGDIVVITAGVPAGVSGTTNLIKVHVVGDVLLRAQGMSSACVYGRCAVIDDPERDIGKVGEEDIVVARATDNRYMDILKKAKAIIVEDDDVLCHAVVVGLALDKPVFINARDATNILRDGMSITAQASTGLIYNGMRQELR